MRQGFWNKKARRRSFFASTARKPATSVTSRPTSSTPTIGALLSIMAYRRGLPLTMRSCFYPLWGKGIEGWKGDILCGNQPKS